jgi:thiol-disulfide isomerase/thioredoxin
MTMMMKKYLIPILLLVAFVINSCDKVDPPYTEKRDYCNGNKNVLIEDYTGHGCNNCPEAAVLANELKEEFCERIVVIAVHAGFFAAPNFQNDTLLSADFRTEAGNTWDTFFGNSASGNPNGLIDRVKGPTGFVFYKDSWRKVADTLLQSSAKALISIQNDFNTNNNTLSTKVETVFDMNVNGNYKVIVCITQDNIIAPQLNKNEEIGEVPIDIDYVHNHVLRGSINGVWGEALNSSGSVAMGETYTKTYSQVFPEDWIPTDCHVVAFIYNEETKQVLQVEELAVID